MLPTKEILVQRCKELRQNATDAERLLWKILRNRQLLGIKFRRQYLFQYYIIDFYAPEIQLAIELDGGQHLEQIEYDQKRTECLQKSGIRVIRFWIDEVLKHLEDVVGVLWEEITRGSDSF